MELFITILLFLVGLVLIVKGGDVFVDAASWMAKVSGIPQFIIGATVVSLATTLPEMLVSFLAAGEGKIDMATGNAVGSVTANIGLIMGVALVCMPTVIRRGEYMVKCLLMLGAAAIMVGFGFTGSIGLVPNILLMLIFVAAMWENVYHARKAMAAPGGALAQSGSGGIETAQAAVSTEAAAAEDAIEEPAQPSFKRQCVVNILKFVLGAAAIVVGAQLLVDNGSALAIFLGVPERIIAVSVVAIGTSLPELVTTLTAIAKKQSALSIGNIIGANIIDLALILPISALISGSALPVSAQSAMVDMPACLIVGLIAIVPALITKKFHRWQGVVMIAFYLAYIIYTTVFLG